MTQPRPEQPTIKYIDDYCASYRGLFKDVRNYEHFKQLHVGMVSDLKRKTLPAIAKLNGLPNHQGLHNFLTQADWETEAVREQRLKLLLELCAGREIVLIVDESGDPKKGRKTDYVTRQYLGRVGKVENGIVAVTVYGYLCGITFPLLFEVFKPKTRLKAGDSYRTKPQIASSLVRKILEFGFKVKLVLSDSLYGESRRTFLSQLEEMNLNYLVAIRRNHGVFLPQGQQVRANRWRKFKRHLSDGRVEERYVREIVYGKRGACRYWEVTTDPETMPDNSTSFVMSKMPDIRYDQVGDLYGLRTWVEYGLKQSKNQLGWADFRLTDCAAIEKWWELVCSSYIMVASRSMLLNQPASDSVQVEQNSQESLIPEHCLWQPDTKWPYCLNNLRLLLQPWVCFNDLKLWFPVFPMPELQAALLRLVALVNCFSTPWADAYGAGNFSFSSA